MRLIILICAILLVACTGTQQRQICEDLGGKWGSVKSKCYRLNSMKQCIKDNTCVDNWHWFAGDYCHKIELGMDKETAIFWLGKPKELNFQHQNTLTWQAYKVDAGTVTADFTNNQLTGFDCPE
ncbi:hypothetical protein [Moraxella sp. K2450]|nr:hypothetical protein [Moraxella sp. K2450]